MNGRGICFLVVGVSQWPKWLGRQCGELEICGSSPGYDTNFSLKNYQLNVMNCDHSTIVRHLHSMGKVKKIGCMDTAHSKPKPQKSAGGHLCISACSSSIGSLNNINHSYPVSLLVTRNGVFMQHKEKERNNNNNNNDLFKAYFTLRRPLGDLLGLLQEYLSSLTTFSILC